MTTADVRPDLPPNCRVGRVVFRDGSVIVLWRGRCRDHWTAQGPGGVGLSAWRSCQSAGDSLARLGHGPAAKPKSPAAG